MSHLQHSCEHLLRECQNHSPPPNLLTCTHKPKNKQYLKKITNPHFMNKISPQQEEENNKLIQRLKRKFHKTNKGQSIKKSELAEDYHIFTQEELNKLAVIDECQHRGINYYQTFQMQHENNTQPQHRMRAEGQQQPQRHVKIERQIHPQRHTQSDLLDPQPTNRTSQPKETAVDRLRKLGQVDNIREQIKDSIEWAEIKENSTNLKGYYFKIKDKKGFVKRAGQTMGRITALKHSKDSDSKKHLGVDQKRSSAKYFHTVLHRKTFGKQFLMSGPETSYHETVKEDLSYNQKMELVRTQAAKYVNKISQNRTIYMTQDRKNALYQCKFVRLAKQIFGSKEFKKFTFSVSNRQNEETNQETKGDIRFQKEEKGCEAQEILQKNYERIREERKRIIQKII